MPVLIIHLPKIRIMKSILTALFMAFSTVLFAQTTWTEIPTNTDKNLNTISFVNDEVGYIGGADSLLLKTSDGGLTWTEVSFTGVNFLPGGGNIVKLQFLTEDIGYMTVGPYTGSYKTTDGGLTWTLLETPGNMCYNQALYFFNENNGFIGGAGCFQGELIGIYDEGNIDLATVNSSSFSGEDVVVDIDFYDANYGLAASRGGRFLKTTDGGLSWDTIPGNGVPLTSVAIMNDTLAYAGFIDEQSSGLGLLVSHDAGETWTGEIEMATFLYPDYNDVHKCDFGYIYSVGQVDFAYEGMIFENKGLGWVSYTSEHPLKALASYSDSTVFAVGDSGLVVTNKDLSLGVSNQNQEPNPLILYPNPANDEINLRLANTSAMPSARIGLYNLTGQRLKNMKYAGSAIDLTGMKPGVYILEISLENRVYRRRFLKD